MSNKSFFLYFFLVASLVFIIANHLGLQLLSYLSKPLMISSLAVHFFLSVKSKFNSFCRFILLALLVSAIGDSMMVFGKGDVQSTYFKIGLLSFFFVHIFYIIAFLKVPNKKGNGYLRKNPFLVLPFFIFLIGFLFFIWPNIPGDLRIPVAFYGQAIIYMSLIALNLKNQISTKAFNRLMAGSLLFILSDISIAFIRFKVDQVHVPQPRLLIMLPYLSGQFLLMSGSLKVMERFEPISTPL